ncbi:hypothetical protein [Tenacibaculum agarivorans]|uniref:hypothetical protein n=1 Tax=Tenacibaculum agarivorans TaxID=1908389 RepID=UPI00094BBB41|nr:hypothetical protein [Tenacibaculum agarivorans]
MAEQNRNTLKEYFKAGEKPTAQEYGDLIDSFVSRTDDDFVETLPPLPDATTTKKGIVEQATLTEVQTGTDDTRFVTPKGAKRAVETFAPVAPVQSVNGQTGDVIIEIENEDTGWQTPLLQNGIENYSSSYQAPRFRKKNGVVYIEGTVRGGIPGPSTTTIFTLPSGFRPSKRLILKGIKSGDVVVRIDISTSGVMYCYDYDTTMVSISGISFLVD